MATYKIPQDVEAEDKLIGPFSFRQFIFLVITAVGIGLAFLLFRVQPILVVIPLPVILAFGVLGIYHREDQPAETFLLAAINFFLKPHRRLWSNEGLIENVKITAPKRMAKPKLKRLGSSEQSQLERLARIIDTRGWSSKRAELTLPGDHTDLDNDDRLVAPVATTNQEPLDVYARDDILDAINNPDAQDYAKLAQSSTQTARQQAVAKMKQAQTANKPDHLSGRNPKQIPQYNPYPQMQQKVIRTDTRQTASLSQNNQLTVSQLAAHAQRKP